VTSSPIRRRRRQTTAPPPFNTGPWPFLPHLQLASEVCERLAIVRHRDHVLRVEGGELTVQEMLFFVRNNGLCKTKKVPGKITG